MHHCGYGYCQSPSFRNFGSPGPAIPACRKDITHGSTRRDPPLRRPLRDLPRSPRHPARLRLHDRRRVSRHGLRRGVRTPVADPPVVPLRERQCRRGHGRALCAAGPAASSVQRARRTARNPGQRRGLDRRRLSRRSQRLRRFSRCAAARIRRDRRDPAALHTGRHRLPLPLHELVPGTHLAGEDVPRAHHGPPRDRSVPPACARLLGPGRRRSASSGRTPAGLGPAADQPRQSRRAVRRQQQLGRDGGADGIRQAHARNGPAPAPFHPEHVLLRPPARARLGRLRSVVPRRALLHDGLHAGHRLGSHHRQDRQRGRLHRGGRRRPGPHARRLGAPAATHPDHCRARRGRARVRGRLEPARPAARATHACDGDARRPNGPVPHGGAVGAGAQPHLCRRARPVAVGEDRRGIRRDALRERRHAARQQHHRRGPPRRPANASSSPPCRSGARSRASFRWPAGTRATTSSRRRPPNSPSKSIHRAATP